MKVARIEHEGAARTAIVADDGVQMLAPGIGVFDVLVDPSLATGERVADVRFLAPIEPPTIRDFSVFEQHIAGVVKHGGPTPVPPVWYASPFCYFSNPHAVTGPGDEIAMPPGCVDLDLELELAAVIGRPGRDLAPTRPKAGSPATRSSTTGRHATSSARTRTRARVLQGEGLRQHARAVDRHRRRARAVPQRRPARPAHDRASINGRELGSDTRGEHGVELGRARLLRVARDVGAAWRRARVGNVRRRLLDGDVGPPRPRRLSAAAARRHGVSDHRGDRDAGEHGRRRRRVIELPRART